MTDVELSDQRKGVIFRQEILSDLIADEEGRALPACPQFLLLGGQPGSGKTGVLYASSRELQGQGATWTINADDFAAYHPRYANLQKSHGAAAADMVRGVTADWIAAAIEAAQERRVSVAFESTMRQPAVVRATLSGFRERGYATHAKVLAVRSMESWLGNHYRREQLAAAGAPSRIATAESHDAALRGSLNTVSMIQAERLVDRLSIVNRSNDLLYQTELLAGHWTESMPAVECLKSLRAEPMSGAEARRHLGRWRAVEHMARIRHGFDAAQGRAQAPGAPKNMELTLIAASRNADAFRLVVDGSLSEQEVLLEVPAVGEAISAYRQAEQFLAGIFRKDEELCRIATQHARDLLQGRLHSGQTSGFMTPGWLEVAHQVERDSQLQR